MTIDSTTFWIFVIGLATGLIGYFLRFVHSSMNKNIEMLLSDIRTLTEDQGKLKGKIELVEQESRLKYQAIQEQTQLEIKNLAKNVSELSTAVKELIIRN
jgi:hypothetical protein